MATLAERAKLKEQETTHRWLRPGGDNAIFPALEYERRRKSPKKKVLPMVTNPTHFSWKERLMTQPVFAGVKGETDSVPYKYRFLVWKCMVIAVKF